jgi:hypothetical protein
MPRRLTAMTIGNPRTSHEAAHLLRFADRDRGDAVVRALLQQLDAADVTASTALYVGAMLLARLITMAPAKERRTVVAGVGDLVLRCSLGAADGETDVADFGHDHD